MNVYTAGDEVKLTGRFFDDEGVPADPTAVTCIMRTPDLEVDPVELSVERVSEGVYQAVFTPELNGLHAWRFAGTGDIQAGSEDVFMCQTMFEESA